MIRNIIHLISGEIKEEAEANTINSKMRHFKASNSFIEVELLEMRGVVQGGLVGKICV